jgi:hypothetical protein
MTIKIKQKTKKEMDGWWGMNHPAAKANKFKGNIKKDEIWVDKSRPDKKRTIKHEKIEQKLMEQGKSYQKAHKIALKKDKNKK